MPWGQKLESATKPSIPIKQPSSKKSQGMKESTAAVAATAVAAAARPAWHGVSKVVVRWPEAARPVGGHFRNSRLDVSGVAACSA
jgi:hypothetical protein